MAHETCVAVKYDEERVLKWVYEWTYQLQWERLFSVPGRTSRFRKSQTSLVYILQWEFSTDPHKLKHRLQNDNSLRSTGPQKLYTWQETLNQEWDKEKDEENKVFLREMLDFTAFCLFLKVFQRNKSLITLKYKIIINYRNREDWELILVSLKEETIFPETC